VLIQFFSLLLIYSERQEIYACNRVIVGEQYWLTREHTKQLRPGLIYTLDASCPCLPAEIWPFFCRRPGLDAGRTPSTDSRHGVCCPCRAARPWYGQHWTASGLIKAQCPVRARDGDGRRPGRNLFVRNVLIYDILYVINTLPMLYFVTKYDIKCRTLCRTLSHSTT
jgi:hypothetical protein